MIEEQIACCLKCQMTLTTHEELSLHSCIMIKLEKHDSKLRDPLGLCVSSDGNGY